jgi:hypothetical protein
LAIGADGQVLAWDRQRLLRCAADRVAPLSLGGRAVGWTRCAHQEGILVFDGKCVSLKGSRHG